jgi:hypothetical protein
MILNQSLIFFLKEAKDILITGTRGTKDYKQPGGNQSKAGQGKTPRAN